MRVLNEKDYRLFERLVSLSQKEMHKAMTQYLKAKYDTVIVTKDYIVAEGKIPIALVAHMDTVFKTPVSNLYYDQRKGVLWSPEGLGADDRAGIFAILKILQDGYRPTVIFTTDEEMGGIGAAILAEKKPCPITNLKYLIQLDRRGTNDCVFYDCYCPEFVTYVESFGFCERWGSFSDISFLMPEWKLCGVNLSVGYEDEHTIGETLHITPLFDTIQKVKQMLNETSIPDFVYNERPITQSIWWSKSDIYGQHCSKCKQLFSEYDLFPVKGIDGKIKFYCPDCVVGNVNWCNYCGEAFEIFDHAADNVCRDCVEGLCTKKSKSNSAK